MTRVGASIDPARDGVPSALSRRMSGRRTAVLDVVRSSGRALDPTTRASMESRFGYDLSSVRVHADQAAARSAELLGASAYTVGRHVAFGEGQYAPSTAEGRRMMTHELTHVIQQARGPVSGRAAGDGLSVSDRSDPFEHDAARSAAAIQSASPGANELRRLPSTSFDPSEVAVQRLALSDPKWGGIGAIAGIASGVLAVAGLAVALWAWLRPKNAAATAAGVSFQPNPFTFTAGSPPDTDSTDVKTAYEAATRGGMTKKILEVRTDDDNVASFNLRINTHANAIVNAQLMTEARGYQGGYNSSTTAVNFSSTSLGPAPAAPATAPAPAAAAPAAGTTAPAAGATAPAAPATTPTAGAPATPAPGPMAAVAVRFNGTNTKGTDAQQTFAGSVLVQGDGSVSMARAAINNFGQAQAVGNAPSEYVAVDYRNPPRRPSAPDAHPDLSRPKKQHEDMGDFPPPPKGLA